MRTGRTALPSTWPTCLRAPTGTPPEGMGSGEAAPVFECAKERLRSQLREARLRPSVHAHLLAEEQPPGCTGIGEAHTARGHEQLGGDALVPHGLHQA